MSRYNFFDYYKEVSNSITEFDCLEDVLGSEPMEDYILIDGILYKRLLK